MSAESAQRTHAIVSNLIRALTHKIRTPLSVISNELEALRAVLPAVELEASRQRVTQITELLKTLSQFAVSPAPKQNFDAQEIVRDLVASNSGRIVLREYAPALPVMGDRRMFALAVNSLAQVLLQLATQESKEPVVMHSRLLEGCGVIGFRCEIRSVLCSSVQRTWASLSDFFNDEIDLDSFLPSCIDSILLAQNVTVCVTAQSAVDITFRFTLCEQVAPKS